MSPTSFCHFLARLVSFTSQRASAFAFISRSISAYRRRRGIDALPSCAECNAD